ncbi:MAG: FecR family protein [Candidatus Thermoplasmatota archaeon]|nr:FecR family protein [Candidatus Thermoplasmatota archaeon]MBU1940244.1 FecR family protein [Candidatus Thermoplasmatota archaeon]
MSKKPEKKENTSNKSTKSASLKRLLFIIIPVIIIVSIIGIIWFTQSSNVVSAQLVINYGTVEVKHEGSNWVAATSGMLLYQSDALRTGDDTFASVILFESSIIRLDSNTEILLKEMIQQADTTNITIEQESGRTWNTIQKISGIDNYEVQTPTTVASVRGTTFDFNMTTSGTTNVSVINGTVNVSRLINGTITETIEVNENESVVVDPQSNVSLGKKPFVKDEWMLRNIVEDETLREQLKKELYDRIEPYIPELKERYGMTDIELEILLDGYLKGYFDLPPETPQWIRDIIESN